MEAGKALRADEIASIARVRAVLDTEAALGTGMSPVWRDLSIELRTLCRDAGRSRPLV